MSEGKPPMIDKVKEKAVAKDAQIVKAEVISAEEQREYKLACEALDEDIKALDIAEQLLVETEGKVQLLQFGIARTLHNVHAKNLYRIEFETWDTFLEEKYGRSRQWGYNMLWYWGVCLIIADGKPLGLSERQARPLVRLLKFPEELKALWDKVKDAPLSFDLSAEVSEKKAAMAVAEEDAAKDSKKGTKRAGSHRGTSSGKKKDEEQEARQQAQAEREAHEKVIAKEVEEQFAELGDEVKERLAEEPDRNPEEVIAEIKEGLKEDILDGENRQVVLESVVEQLCYRNFGLPDDFDPEHDVFFEGETITQRCWHWAEVALDALEKEANLLAVKWQEQDLDKEEDDSDSDEDEDEDVPDDEEEDAADDAADAAAIAEELRMRGIKK
jgi:hypothetical protein